MFRWLFILVLAAPVGVAGCGAGAGAHPHPTLTITVRSGASVLRTRTLGCDPPAGTTHDPAAACRALRDYLRQPPAPHLVCHCPAIFAASRFALIRGTLDGRPVRIRFGPCPCGSRTFRDLSVVTGLHTFSPPP